MYKTAAQIADTVLVKLAASLGAYTSKMDSMRPMQVPKPAEVLKPLKPPALAQIPKPLKTPSVAPNTKPIQPKAPTAF